MPKVKVQLKFQTDEELINALKVLPALEDISISPKQKGRFRRAYATISVQDNVNQDDFATYQIKK